MAEKKDLRLFGVQKSGTQYLQYLLEQNWHVNIVGGDKATGEKHLLPKQVKINEPTLHIIRNPFSWFISFRHYARTYSWTRLGTTDLENMEHFHNAWNKRNRVYTRECSHSVRYEDLLNYGGERVLSHLMLSMGFERKSKTFIDTKNSFRYPVERHKSSERDPKKLFDKDFLTNNGFFSYATREEWVAFADGLDQGLIEKFNYGQSEKLARGLPNEPVEKALHTITNRKQFPAFLQKYALNKRMIEIGVRRGNNLLDLATASPELLVGVDHWRVTKRPTEQDTGLNDIQLERLYRELFARTFNDFPYIKLMRASSRSAARAFPAEFFDFVYIDADHEESAVLGDMRRWWPLVHVGGVLAGHDYVRIDPRTGMPFGVVDAVQSFLKEKNIPQEALVVTNEKWPSWAIYKKPEYC